MTTVSYRSFTSPQVPLSILARSPSKFCTFNITAIFPLFFPPLQGAFILGIEESWFSSLAETHGKSLCLAATYISLENLLSWCWCFCLCWKIPKLALPSIQEEAPFPEIVEQTCKELAGVCPAPALHPPYFILWLLLFKCLFAPAHLLKMWHLAPNLLCDMPSWC